MKKKNHSVWEYGPCHKVFLRYVDIDICMYAPARYPPLVPAFSWRRRRSAGETGASAPASPPACSCSSAPETPRTAGAAGGTSAPSPPRSSPAPRRRQPESRRTRAHYSASTPEDLAIKLAALLEIPCPGRRSSASFGNESNSRAQGFQFQRIFYSRLSRLL